MNRSGCPLYGYSSQPGPFQHININHRKISSNQLGL